MNPNSIPTSNRSRWGSRSPTSPPQPPEPEPKPAQFVFGFEFAFGRLGVRGIENQNPKPNLSCSGSRSGSCSGSGRFSLVVGELEPAHEPEHFGFEFHFGSKMLKLSGGVNRNPNSSSSGSASPQKLVFAATVLWPGFVLPFNLTRRLEAARKAKPWDSAYTVPSLNCKTLFYFVSSCAGPGPKNPNVPKAQEP